MDPRDGRRAPRAPRGLKLKCTEYCQCVPEAAPLVGGVASDVALLGLRGRCGRRAPRGARGLKLLMDAAGTNGSKSRPSWGAWIETGITNGTARIVVVAPLVGRVD